jgi:hypothetical protein
VSGRGVTRPRPSRLLYRESYEWPIAPRHRMRLDFSPARSAYFLNGTLRPNSIIGVLGAFLRTIRTIYASLSPRTSRYASSRPLLPSAHCSITCWSLLVLGEARWTCVYCLITLSWIHGRRSVTPASKTNTRYSLRDGQNESSMRTASIGR